MLTQPKSWPLLPDSQPTHYESRLEEIRQEADKKLALIGDQWGSALSPEAFFAANKEEK